MPVFHRHLLIISTHHHSNTAIKSDNKDGIYEAKATGLMDDGIDSLCSNGWRQNEEQRGDLKMKRGSNEENLRTEVL